MLQLGGAEAPVVFAESEDELITWYSRTSSRCAALRDAASLYGESAWARWRWRVTREHMRPATRVEEGWYLVCDAAYPGAIAVWRVEWTGGTELGDKLRMRLRRLHRAGRPLKQPRYVLWGGHVIRKSTWLDRLLLGPGHIVVRGDCWLRLHDHEWRWCYGCDRLTPHRPMAVPGGWWCDSPDHRVLSRRRADS